MLEMLAQFLASSDKRGDILADRLIVSKHARLEREGALPPGEQLDHGIVAGGIAGGGIDWFAVLDINGGAQIVVANIEPACAVRSGDVLQKLSEQPLLYSALAREQVLEILISLA